MKNHALRSYDLILVAMIGALISTLFHVYGIGGYLGTDGVGYVELARQLADGSAWTTVPDLTSTAIPTSLLRLPGYAALIILFQSIAGDWWVNALVIFQYAVAAFAACVLYRTTAAISGLRLLGLAAAALFLVSRRAYFDRWILTDSLYTSVLTIGLCLGAWAAYSSRPSIGRFALAGIAAAILFLFREMTLAIVAAALPLLALIAWGADGYRMAGKRIAAFYGPILAIVLCVIGWNTIRVGTPLITTGAQAGPIYAMTQLEKRGTRVFDRDEPLDEIARRHLKTYEFVDTVRINIDLHKELGLTAPAIASVAGARYVETILNHPTAVLELVRANLSDWDLLFVSNEFYEVLPQICPNFQGGWQYQCLRSSYYLMQLFWICFVVLPLAFGALALAVPNARRAFLLLASLWLTATVPVLLYSVVNFEVRYALYTAPIFLLMISVAIGSLLSTARRSTQKIITILAQLAQRRSASQPRFA